MADENKHIIVFHQHNDVDKMSKTKYLIGNYKKILVAKKWLQNVRDKKTLAQFEQHDKVKHRITLKFEENNALEKISITVCEKY